MNAAIVKISLLAAKRLVVAGQLAIGAIVVGILQVVVLDGAAAVVVRGALRFAMRKRRKWRKRVGVEPTQDRQRPLPGLKSGRPTGSDSLPCCWCDAGVAPAPRFSAKSSGSVVLVRLPGATRHAAYCKAPQLRRVASSTM